MRHSNVPNPLESWATVLAGRIGVGVDAESNSFSMVQASETILNDSTISSRAQTSACNEIPQTCSSQHTTITTTSTADEQFSNIYAFQWNWILCLENLNGCQFYDLWLCQYVKLALLMHTEGKLIFKLRRTQHSNKVICKHFPSNYFQLSKAWCYKISVSNLNRSIAWHYKV